MSAPTPNKALRPIDEVRGALTKMGDQFKMTLPAHIPLERFQRIVQTAISNTPALLKADRTSLFASCMKAAECGLLPNGVESALIPFGDKVTFLPMISGILKLVRQSGELSTITSQIVYKNDQFEYFVNSDGEHIKHVPNMFSDRGEILGAYAIAKTKDGGLYVEVMSNEQIKSVESVSRGKNGPWQGPFRSEMIRKTVLKRLAKRLPLSTDLDIAMRADDDLYDLTPAVDATPAAPKKPKQSRLGKLMGDVQADMSTVETDAKPDLEPPTIEEQNLPI